MTVNVDDRSAGDELGLNRVRHLTELAATGNHEAWERIYRAAYPRLRAYAAHHVGHDSADDVVSETMTRAVAGIDGFRWTDAGIEPWLFGIARRVAADHHRAAGRRRRWSRAVAAPVVMQPSDAVELADEHAAVRVAFDRLAAGDRDVLALRVIAGMSPEQTAEVLGKRPGAVRTAQSRALGRLRKGTGVAMTDNELLERLAVALVPVAVPTEPPAASLQDLHRAIDAAQSRRATTGRHRRAPRVLTISVAVGVVAVVCAALVFASTSLRHIDGETAVQVSASVNSPELFEARARSDALQDALERRDVAAVVVEAEKLRSILVRLTPADRAIVGIEVFDLLERADGFVEEHLPADTALTTVTSTLPPATTAAPLVPAATSPATASVPTAGSPSSATAPVVMGDDPVADSGDDSGSNSGPGGGGSGEDSGDIESVDDAEEDNSGPGGGG